LRSASTTLRASTNMSMSTRSCSPKNRISHNKKKHSSPQSGSHFPYTKLDNYQATITLPLTMCPISKQFYNLLVLANIRCKIEPHGARTKK
jgi:hypothetical protein